MISKHDIHARTFRNGYPQTINIHVFTDISLQLSMLLWISIWILLNFYVYPYPCIDLLWILDPGNGLRFDFKEFRSVFKDFSDFK